MSMFNPESFMDAALTTPSERRQPLPVGDYLAQIGEITPRVWQGKKDPLKSGVAMDVALEIQLSPELQAELGYDTSTLKLSDSIMLDLTPNGTIDLTPGKNARLRLYREACDMNKVGDTFSFRAMSGKLVLVKLKHEIWEGNTLEKIAGLARS